MEIPVFIAISFFTRTFELGHVKTYFEYEKNKDQISFAITQTDQHLCFSLTGKYIQHFKPLVSRSPWRHNLGLYLNVSETQDQVSPLRESFPN